MIERERNVQSLAAYSFEAQDIAPEKRLSAMSTLVDSWLATKGAAEPREPNGSFVSKTGDGTGQFFRHEIQSKAGVLHEVELIETAHTGAMFTTNIQFAAVGKRIVVYASLGAAPGGSRVAPIGLSPRCPWIIRSLIEKFGDWKFAGQEIPLPIAFDATDDDSARVLCQSLRSDTRRLPVVVVSTDKDEEVWTDLHTKLAESLIGLADVAQVGAESSWILTDELGPRDSCYLGAVRLYWPGTRQDGSLPGINWRASQLERFGVDDAGRNRFLTVVRREVMSAAALTMPFPQELREIRNIAEKERLHSLEADSRNSELDSIIEENARLATQLAKAESTIQALQWKLNSASYAERKTEAANDNSGVASTDVVDEIRQPPKAGEIRYYKKIGSGGGIDSLVETKCCSHKDSNWKPAFKGVQAEKGLLKLEGRNDWQSIAHCSSCTGGGRWRVHW